jgi:hypothetical protein
MSVPCGPEADLALACFADQVIFPEFRRVERSSTCADHNWAGPNATEVKVSRRKSKWTDEARR